MNIKELFGTQETGLKFGTEYEIEAIQAHGAVNSQFYVENDHSLRNNGHEYKTKPVSYDKSLELFKFLHANLKYGDDAFSERTSIHVHMNIGDFTTHQAKQLVLFYTLLEPLFFKFVGPKREHSIFCVPLTHTALSKHYNLPFEKLVGMWSKYTAFNILPVKEYGTVEFRHLYGTKDYETYKKWLTILKELYTYIEKNPEVVITKLFAKDVDVATLAQEVVPTLASDFSTRELHEMMYDTSLDVKLSVGGF